MEMENINEFPVSYFFKEEFLPNAINHVFGSVFSQFYKFIRSELPKDFTKIKVQFLRESISKGVVKSIENENSNFEGSLVIMHRENISGGESQIIETQKDDSKEVIFPAKIGSWRFCFFEK